MRHNLSGGHVVLLSNEDPQEFIQHSFGYIDRFAPADHVERDLVNQLIAASWRLARISALECSLFEMEMDRQREEHDAEFAFLDAHARQTLTLLGVDESEGAMLRLHRYQSTARRAYTTAFRALRELQGDRFNRPPSIAPEAVEHDHSNTPEPEQAPAEPHQEQSAAEPQNTAPRVIVFSRRTHENTKLQSEPEPAACDNLYTDTLQDNRRLYAGTIS